jgi:hypothetical protein
LLGLAVGDDVIELVSDGVTEESIRFIVPGAFATDLVAKDMSVRASLRLVPAWRAMR